MLEILYELTLLLPVAHGIQLLVLDEILELLRRVLLLRGIIHEVLDADVEYLGRSVVRVLCLGLLSPLPGSLLGLQLGVEEVV